MIRHHLSVVLILLAVLLAAPAAIGQEGHKGEELTTTPPAPQPGAGVSGLPLPRFVSISSARVNLRMGPGRQYPIEWILQRRHLPVEVIGEFEHWRKIRDRSGEVGWVHKSMLSGKRMGLVISSRKTGELIPAYAAAGSDKPVLMVEAGAIGEISECQGEWCIIRFEKSKGWMRRDSLWGVYPNEEIAE